MYLALRRVVLVVLADAPRDRTRLHNRPNRAEDDAQSNTEGCFPDQGAEDPARACGGGRWAARRWRAFQRRGGGVAFGRVCVVRASAPRRSNVQAGGIAEPQHFGSARMRAASAPQNEQQMQAGAIGAFLAAARRRTPVFFCALVRRLRNVLGMTNQPWLQRETGTRPC